LPFTAKRVRALAYSTSGAAKSSISNQQQLLGYRPVYRREAAKLSHRKSAAKNVKRTPIPAKTGPRHPVEFGLDDSGFKHCRKNVDDVVCLGMP